MRRYCQPLFQHEIAAEPQSTGPLQFPHFLSPGPKSCFGPGPRLEKRRKWQLKTNIKCVYSLTLLSVTVLILLAASAWAWIVSSYPLLHSDRLGFLYLPGIFHRHSGRHTCILATATAMCQLRLGCP